MSKKTEVKQTEQMIDDKTQNVQNLNLFLKNHNFVPRVSILDDYEPTSIIKQSHFMGIYNCVYIIMAFYLITTPLLKYRQKGVFIEARLLELIERDFLLVAITWPLVQLYFKNKFYLWSHVSLLNQYLTLLHVPHQLISIFQHGSQSCMFFYCHYLVTTHSEWGILHGAYVTFQSCVFFMKMHSYTQTNKKLRIEWIKNGKIVSSDPYSYPNNISFNNFTLYMWMPVLVYETQYPRTDKIRWNYVIRKLAYTFACLNVDYIIISENIMPVITNIQDYSVLESTYKMCLPMVSFCLLTFFLIFENLLNFFAEITRFADRLFYQDWWNSANYEEYNRKWNRPVYEFLYRHIYLEAITVYGCSAKKAQLMTFIFSALLHEYTFAVSLQTVTPIMTVFMLIQVPLIMYTRKLKGTQSGNLLFWYFEIQGVPLILNFYARYDEMREKGLQFSIL